MKKLMSFLIILFATAVSASAMSLEEAFNALSHIPYVSLKVNVAPSTIVIDAKADNVGSFKVATASGLDGKKIYETGNAALTILNQVPLMHMVNGANNNLVGAFLYATPNRDGKYDFLVVAMSGYVGDVTIIYTTIDEATKNSFQQAKLTMEGASLKIIPERTKGSSPFNILINGPE